MKLASIWQSWNEFWFQTASPTPIALFRIWLGLILLQDALWMRIEDWKIFYSTHPLIPVTTYMKLWWGREPRFDLIDFLPSDSLRLGLLILYAILLVGMILGLYTRASCLGALMINESMFNQFTLNISGADVFLKIALLITTFSNAGDAFSLDNLRRALKTDWRTTGFRPPAKPQWALRMMQMQICIIYALTGSCKLGGPSWIDGSAVYYVTRCEDLARFDVPFVLNNVWTMKALSWSTLLFELCFSWMVWIKELRYPVILIAILFHLGLEWTCNIPIFELAFVGSFLVFVHPSDLTKVMNSIKAALAKKLGSGHEVLFNLENIDHVHLTGLIHRMDIFDRLMLKPKDNPHENAPSSVDSIEFAVGSRRLKGFEAFRLIALRLPLAWPLTPFLFLPVVSFISHRLFETFSKFASKSSINVSYSPMAEEKLRFKLVYWRLALLMVFIALVCLGNLPEQINQSHNAIARSQILATAEHDFAKEANSEMPGSEKKLQALTELGWIQFQENNRENAEMTFLQALKLEEAKKNDSYSFQYVQCLINLAVFYRDCNNFGEARKYFSMVQAYDSKYMPHGKAMGRDLANLAVNDYLDGEAHFNEDDRNRMLEHGLSLCKEAETEYSRIQGTERLIGNVLNTEFLILRDLGKIEAAQDAKNRSARILHDANLKTIEP